MAQLQHRRRPRHPRCRPPHEAEQAVAQQLPQVPQHQPRRRRQARRRPQREPQLHERQRDELPRRQLVRRPQGRPPADPHQQRGSSQCLARTFGQLPMEPGRRPLDERDELRRRQTETPAPRRVPARQGGLVRYAHGLAEREEASLGVCWNWVTRTFLLIYRRKFVNLAGAGREPTRNAWTSRAATRNDRGRPRRPHRGATSPVTAECGVGRDDGSIRWPKFEGAAIAVKPTLGSISNFGYWKPITTVHDGTSPRPRARGCGGNEACR